MKNLFYGIMIGGVIPTLIIIAFLFYYADPTEKTYSIFEQKNNCDILIKSFKNSNYNDIYGPTNYTLIHYWNLPAYSCSQFYNQEETIEQLLTKGK